MTKADKNKSQKISKREITILKLICEEKSSVEIAEILEISLRTVDGHRNSLLHKTGVKTIAGLVIYAIQNNYFEPQPQ